MKKLIRRVRYFVSRRQIEAELAEELEFHRGLKQQELAGRAAASRAMGNLTLAREDARAVWIAPWLESFWRDLIYGVRLLWREPGFTFVALLALGSTIGINTSLFTVFNAVALRPWPVKDPARVVSMYHLVPADPAHNRAAGPQGFTLPEFRYLAEHTQTLSGIVAMRGAGPLRVEDVPVNFATYVSGNYFATLGVEMERGRGFLPEEDRAGAPQAVAVIADSLWQNRFGADPQILGKQIRLETVPFRVVGVAPRDFFGTWTDKPVSTEIWIPFASMALLRPNDPMTKMLTSTSSCCAQLAGRLSPGASRAQAQSEVRLLSQQFAASMGDESSPVRLAGTAMLANPAFQQKAASIVSLIFLAVTLILLLACANVGNLLLARAAARRQEIAVRLSLGGSRVRLIRQLLVESLTLALAASALGLEMAAWLPSFAVRRLTDSAVPRLAPDQNVFLYAVLLAVLACLAFGLAPALHATRGRIMGALKDQNGIAGVRFSLRNALLAAQVAISVILLAGAGLLVRGMQAAAKLDPGFAFHDVTVVSAALPADAYGGPRMEALIRNLSDSLRSTPDLPTWALAVDAPLGQSNHFTDFRLPGERPKDTKIVRFQGVTEGYFDLLRIPVVAGRGMTGEDASRPVAWINETMAKRYWPHGAVGKILHSNSKDREIAGVVKDAFTSTLGRVEPTLYFPLTGQWLPVALMRSGGPGAERITAMIKSIEPRADVHQSSLEVNFERAIQPAGIGAAIAGSLGLLALLLATLGMSGVFAYAVQQRTREIGIRIAVGARPRQVVRLVLGSSLGALMTGLAAGVAGAFALSEIIARQFYGVNPFDLPAYAAVLLLLAAGAILASAGPALRAARLDPVTALRWE